MPLETDVPRAKTKEELELELEKSKEYSIKDGAFYSLMSGFGSSYITAFAVRLGAGITEVGLLQTLPQLIGSLAQFFYSRLARIVKSRKEIVLKLVSIQAATWLALIALALISGESMVSWLIAFYTISISAELLANPAWTSWMGDIVKEKDRATYFGRRNEILSFVALLASFAAGAVLWYFDGLQAGLLGFALIFSVAFLGRMVSWYFLSKKTEPRIEEISTDGSFRVFLHGLTKTNFGTFVLYESLLNFAVFVSTPYFAVYSLNNLHVDYITFALLMNVSQVTLFLTMVYWGDTINKLGNKNVLFATGLIVAVVPLYWGIFTLPWVIILGELLSGIGWAGQRIASFNLLLKTTPERDKAKFVAYYNACQGVAIFAGAMLGAYLAGFFSSAPQLALLGPLPMVFMVSFVLRLAAVVLLIPRLEEPESKGFQSKAFLFKTITVYPVQSAMYEVQSGFKKGLHRAFEIEEDFVEMRKKVDEQFKKLKIRKIEF